MKSLNKGMLLITVCVAIIITMVFSLYKELTVSIKRDSSEAIGTIVFKKKSAERKYSEFVIWESIANNSPVYNYDSVRTFKDSAAYIKLNNGAEIALEEDTMIMLIVDDEGVNIDFNRGLVSAKSGDQAEKINLKTKDVSISMDNGELSLKKTADVVNVNVSEGEATIDTVEGETETIDNSSSAKVTQGRTEVKKVSIIPDYPFNNTFFITYKNSDNINFRWKSDSTETEKLQISKDYTFSNIVHTSNTSERNNTVNLIPGEYYWKLTSGNEASPIRKFTLIKDTAPQLFYPAQNDKLTVQGASENIDFKWSRSDFCSSYSFKISSNKNMQNPSIEKKIQLNFASVDKLSTGTYFWNVTRTYPSGFILLDKNVKTGGFEINRIKLVRKKPSPLHNKNMFASTLDESIMFNWTEQKEVQKYTVDISHDSAFSDIIISSSAKMSFYNAGKLSEGTYYWKVTAHYPDGESLSSDTVTLQVVPPKPVVNISPSNGSIVPGNGKNITFSWKDELEVGNYLVETSSGSDFSNITHSYKTASKSYMIKTIKPGTYYWRVSIVDKNGEIAVKGKTSSFIVPETMPKPSALSPSNMGVVNLDNIEVIHFKWKPVEGADSYELSVFQRVSGVDKPLTVIKTKATQVLLSDFLNFNPGTIVWVVKAKKTDGGEVTASSDSGRNYFTLKVSEDLSAPTTTAPETIYVK